MGAIGPAFVSMVAATSAITALVGSRVYPAEVKIADDVYPLVAYRIENVTTNHTYDGAQDALRSCNIVITCVGTTYASADAVADALLTAMDGQSGTWGGTTVQGCFLNDDSISDDVVTNAETEEIMLYTKQLSMLVWFVR